MLPAVICLGMIGCDGLKELSGGGDSSDGDAVTTPKPVIGSQPSTNSPGSGGLIQQVMRPKGPDVGITAAQCGGLTDGGPVNGPDCVTQEIKCGETITGHTKGGVNLYNTRFYEKNTCWPGTRNHNGGDERVYMWVADKSPRFQNGETRQRISVYFDTPCADLTFTKMVGELNTCPKDYAKLCDSANPFRRESGTRNIMNITADAGEVYYFLVEGADDAEGAFSITLECGT